MNITQAEIVNTGGNYLVLELTVVDGGALKSIVIADGTMAGLNVQHPYDEEHDLYNATLWHTDSWINLIDYIDIKTAVAVRKLFLAKWPYTDFMKHGKRLDKFITGGNNQ